MAFLATQIFIRKDPIPITPNTQLIIPKISPPIKVETLFVMAPGADQMIINALNAVLLAAPLQFVTALPNPPKLPNILSKDAFLTLRISQIVIGFALATYGVVILAVRTARNEALFDRNRRDVGSVLAPALRD